MFFIEKPGQETVIGQNPPGDDITQGLIDAFGSDIRIVSATTLADHQSIIALRNEHPEGGDNVVTLDGLTITATSAAGKTLATWEGVLVYPLPPVVVPPPPVLPEIDLGELQGRCLKMAITIDDLAAAIGLAPRTQITTAVAHALVAELLRQEERASLPRIGDFTPKAPEPTAPATTVTVEPATPEE